MKGKIILSKFGEFFSIRVRGFWALIGLAGITVIPFAWTQCFVTTIFELFTGTPATCSSTAGTNHWISYVAATAIAFIAVWLRIHENDSEKERVKQDASTRGNNANKADAHLVAARERETLTPTTNQQTTFSVPEIDLQKTANLQQLKKTLLDYASANLEGKFISLDTPIPDGSQQSIFSVGSARFSTFIAIASESRSLLMIDRHTNKAPVSKNKNRYDFFGSIGYENLSIETKLFQSRNYPRETGLNIVRYHNIPGIAIENISFDNGKQEVAVMIGHLAIVKDSDLAKIQLDSGGELRVFGKNDYHSAYP